MRYVFNEQVYEIDMANAGLSIIQERKLLDDSMIAKIISIPKKDRSIFIGRLDKKDKSLNLSKNITEGINYYLDLFIKENNIEKDTIVIRNRDAIYLKGIQPAILNFDNNIEFKIKANYNYFLKLNKIDLFYNSKNKKYTVKNVTNKENVSECDFLIQKIFNILELAKDSNELIVFKEFNKLRGAVCDRIIPRLLINIPSCSYEIILDNSVLYLNNIENNELDIIQYVNISFHLRYIFPLLSTILIENM